MTKWSYMKLLGIDYGDKRIGLAIGDSTTKIAVPFLILENENKKQVLTELQKVIKEENVEQIVVGFPYTAKEKNAGFDSAPLGLNSGRRQPLPDSRFQIPDSKMTELREEDLENEQGQKVLQFVKYLKEQLDVPVVMHDERLSTREADNLIRGHGDLKENDDVAAMVILQAFLDANFNN